VVEVAEEVVVVGSNLNLNIIASGGSASEFLLPMSKVFLRDTLILPNNLAIGVG
jgi:hypothetical protein